MKLLFLVFGIIKIILTDLVRYYQARSLTIVKPRMLHKGIDVNNVKIAKSKRPIRNAKKEKLITSNTKIIGGRISYQYFLRKFLRFHKTIVVEKITVAIIQITIIGRLR